VIARRLRTDRLAGTALAEADWPDFRALLLDPRVSATIGGLRPEAEIRDRFDADLRHWREHGFGIWTFRGSDGAFVGRCGIHRWSLDDRPEVELGYIVRSPLWSRGYATEMGRAVVDHAFSTLSPDSLVGFTRPGNAASRRVLEKLGFVYERTFAARGEESVLYRLASSSPRP